MIEPSGASGNQRQLVMLSDMEILERLVAEGDDCIFVSPLIDLRAQLGPSSLDVRLGTELVTTKTSGNTHIDLGAGKESVEEQTTNYALVRQIAPDGYFVLHPGEFALAHTLEYIRLPRDIAARIEGRSSFGRLGLQIHATAGFVDPGFEGALTFELMNSGKLPVKLTPGVRLGQLCFFGVSPVQVSYMEKRYSKYGKRLGVELARIHEDPEVTRPEAARPAVLPQKDLF